MSLSSIRLSVTYIGTNFIYSIALCYTISIVKPTNIVSERVKVHYTIVQSLSKWTIFRIKAHFYDMRELISRMFKKTPYIYIYALPGKSDSESEISIEQSNWVIVLFSQCAKIEKINFLSVSYFRIGLVWRNWKLAWKAQLIVLFTSCISYIIFSIFKFYAILVWFFILKCTVNSTSFFFLFLKLLLLLQLTKIVSVKY